MRRVALYCRVSTDTQEKEETIENQLRELRKVYEKDQIIKVYTDTASGSDLDREGLNELRRDAQKKLCDVVGVWDTSRLARDTKLTLILLEEFRQNDIQIEVMGKPLEDSPEGKFLITMLAALDEMEKEKIKRRFMAGKRRLLAEGKLIGCYPPYGYNYVRKDRQKGIETHFEINEEEARIVRKVFQLYLELQSIFLVAKKLAELGIKNRGKGLEKPKLFHASMVKKMLRNEVYIGNWYYGKTSPCLAKYHIKEERKHKLTGRKINPKSDWVLIKVPPIIDKETFERVQEIMKRRHRERAKESKFPILCKGLIRCVECGRRYGARKNGRYLVYRCPQSGEIDFNQPRCRSRSIVVHKLDAIVWDYVSNLIQNKEKVKEKIQFLQRKRDEERISNQRMLEGLKEEKRKMKEKINKLLELYSDEGIPKDDLKAKIEEFRGKEAFLDVQIKEVEDKLKNIEDMEKLEKEVEKLCEMYQNKIRNAPFELKRYIVRKWVKKINVLKDGRIVMKVNLPEWELTPTFQSCYSADLVTQRNEIRLINSGDIVQW